jgi:exodeoxyribonuclease-5
MDQNPVFTLQQRIIASLGLPPTVDQQQLIGALSEFYLVAEGKHLFVLKGYAGTGKTSVMGAFVKALTSFKLKTRLLAPTGRAAKVFSLRSAREAFTIHKIIYRRNSKVDEGSGMTLAPNLHVNTVFIVDEASMIGDYSMQNDGSISSRNLLEDLFEYVYSGKNCRLILLGDEGQLPPVGCDHSPALNSMYLKEHYPMLQIREFRLLQVLRQAEASGILFNATQVRNLVDAELPKFTTKGFFDFVRLTGDELQGELESCYSRSGADETIIVTRSNKRANAYNNSVRSRILYYEEEVCSGDCLMVVKNNYYWTDDKSQMGFIANGELMKVLRVKRVEEQYGFQFVRLVVKFVDYEEVAEMEVLAFLESLQVEAPSLSRSRLKELFFAVEQDYLHEKNKKKRYELILKDPYFNALQVKYAYAVTCHKSQGGQWENVFIDPGFVDEEAIDQEYHRWLYTAMTRASEKLYLVNFPDNFFESEKH